MTARDVLREGAAALSAAGVSAAVREAAEILGCAWGRPWLSVYLAEDAPAASVRDVYWALLARRARREPLQYVIGTCNFCGLSLLARRGALVPRPETETLVEAAVAHLRASRRAGRPLRALDLCTGSGAVALAVAAAFSAADGLAVDATDVSEEALALAHANAARTGLADRVAFHRGDLFAALPAGAGPYDAVLANPPYVPTAEVPSLAPEIRDWEPRLALDGGSDGLDFYRAIAAGAPAILTPGGRLFLEIGSFEAAAAARALLAAAGFAVGLRPDATGAARVLVARRVRNGRPSHRMGGGRAARGPSGIAHG